MTFDVWKSKYISIPGFELNVGGLFQLYVQPCTTSPYILARTVVPSALSAFIGLEIPDPKEAFKIATSKIIGTEYSLLKGVKGYVAEAKQLVLDAWQPLDEDAILEAESLEELEAAAEKYIWDILEFGERAVFWLFIASLIEEFFINWSTQVYKQSGCTPDADTHWIHAGTDLQDGAATTTDWFGCTAWKDCPSSGGLVPDQGYIFTVPADATWSLTAYAQMYKFNGNPQGAEFRLYNTTQDKQEAFSFNNRDLFDPSQFGILDTKSTNRSGVSNQIHFQAKLDGTQDGFPVNTNHSKFHFSWTLHPEEPIRIESAAFAAFAGILSKAAIPPVKGTPLDWLDHVAEELPKWLYGN